MAARFAGFRLSVGCLTPSFDNRKIYIVRYVFHHSRIVMHPFFHPFLSQLRRHHHDRHPRHFGRHEHRGFAGFGGRHGFADDPTGAGFDGLGRGRKLGSADLQLLLLALLADRPSHGYELIKALDERSRGYYSPSPGMVYPALTYLEEIGHASVAVEGAKKRYQVTADGLAYLESQRANVDALLEQLALIGERMARMRRAMRDDGSDEATASSGRDARRGRRRHPGASPEVEAATQNLRAALGKMANAPIAEQRRIAAVLERAAADIRAIETPPDEGSA